MQRQLSLTSSQPPRYLTQANRPAKERGRLLAIANTGQAAMPAAEALNADAAQQTIPKGQLAWTIPRFRALDYALETAEA